MVGLVLLLGVVVVLEPLGAHAQQLADLRELAGVGLARRLLGLDVAVLGRDRVGEVDLGDRLVRIARDVVGGAGFGRRVELGDRVVDGDLEILLVELHRVGDVLGLDVGEGDNNFIVSRRSTENNRHNKNENPKNC